MTSWSNVTSVIAQNAKLEAPSMDLRNAYMRYRAMTTRQTVSVKYARSITNLPKDCHTETNIDSETVTSFSLKKVGSVRRISSVRFWAFLTSDSTLRPISIRIALVLTV